MPTNPEFIAHSVRRLAIAQRGHILTGSTAKPIMFVQTQRDIHTSAKQFWHCAKEILTNAFGAYNLWLGVTKLTLLSSVIGSWYALNPTSFFLMTLWMCVQQYHVLKFGLMKTDKKRQMVWINQIRFISRL